MNRQINIVCLAGLVVMIGYSAWTGIIGTDFGYHWDEGSHYWTVNRTFKTRTIIPDTYYIYPSMTYLVSLLSVSGDVISEIINFEGDIVDFDAAFKSSRFTIPPERFFVRARGFFVVFSGLGGLWLFLAAARLKGPLAGLVAAATYLFSWEFAYHARWIATDALVAQFFALFIFTMVMAETSQNRPRWMILSAIAAGLATSTKYPAGMLLIILLFSHDMGQRDGNFKLAVGRGEWLGGMGKLVAVYSAAYLVITPGTLLQPLDFFLDVTSQFSIYTNSLGEYLGVRPYDIHNPLVYLGRIIEYLSLAQLSRSAPISVLLLALAGLGYFALFREYRRFAAVLAALFIFAAMFFSALSVFTVRNILFFLPMLSLLAGVGAGYLFHGSLAKVARAAIGGLLAAIFALKAFWLYGDAMAIRDYHEAAPAIEAAAYMRSNPQTSFLLSKGTRARIEGAGGAIPENAAGNKAKAGFFLFSHREIVALDPDLGKWPATGYGNFRWFGTNEVNFNYYPTWEGRDRIVMITMDQALDFGIPIDLLAGLGNVE